VNWIHWLLRIVFSRFVLILVGILVALGILGVWGTQRLSASRTTGTMLTHVVTRGHFVHDITETGSVESARNVDIASKVRSMSGSGVAILEIVPEGTVIRPEDCIGEDAVVPLEVIKQLEEYHRAHGIRLADYGTERDPRKRTDLGPPRAAPSEAPEEKTPGGPAMEPLARADFSGESSGGSQASNEEAKNSAGTSSNPAPGAANSTQATQGSPANRLALTTPSGNGQPGNGNGSSPAQVRPQNGPNLPSIAEGVVERLQLTGLPLRQRDLKEIIPELTPPIAGKRLLTFEEVRDKMVLVRLDSASLENQRVQQQITCENSRASVIQALSNYEASLIALQEYLEGTYRQQLQDLLYQELMAEENLARAQQYYEYSKELYAKGYISERELQANEFDVQKKKVELETIKTKRRVLDKYTREKMLTQLQADIESARAKLEAARRNYLLDLQKLGEIEEQIANCTIFATRPGQVVYANERDYRGGTTVVIEPGTIIRERQVIIRLPDPSQMRVVARINESRVNLVQRGMRAKILLDAFLNYEITGVVEEVSDYPAPTSYWLQNVKEYEAKVRIENPPPGLRPGFTAQVRIRVAEVPNVLQVPVQAVLEHGNKYYCILVRGKDSLEAREVRLGLTNDKFVIIEEGLQEGDVVLLNPREFRERVNLPKVSEGTGGGSDQSQDREEPGSGSPGLRAGLASEPGQRNQEGAVGARPGGPPGDGAGPGSLAGQAGASPAPEGDRSGPPGGERPRGPGGRPGGPPPDPAQLFSRWDRNTDGKLDREEVPEFLRAAFDSIDANRDGQLDVQEFQGAARQLLGRRPGGPGGPGGPRGAEGNAPSGGIPPRESFRPSQGP
jgi:HlyD family secretion protein